MMIADSVMRLEPYVPGEQPKASDVVKLNTNENPYAPSPRCAEVLASFNLDRLRRYPDPVFCELREAIAELNSTTSARVFVGNGSDEILALSARAFLNNDGTIASLDPSYSLYKTVAAIRDVRWQGFTWPVAQDCAASLFLLTNPNAPTGEFIEPSEIAAFAKRFNGVLLIDEAYADFARDNCMRLASREDNKNIIVMRTFSKSYSLAGLRVGYCVGPEELVEALYKVKDSYNIDAIAQAVALAAFRDQSWMRANAERIRCTRAEFTAQLERRGWDVLPSESNFVFARPPDCTSDAKAADIFKRLRAQNIFVRYFPGPKTGSRLRITIGTDEQMKRLLDALDTM